ncbi:MAG TPA: hypothetical protein VF236_08025 [Gaiellaceae bacterium]
MQGGFGPRFALEAGFLIAVAIAAGVAELSATAIVAVMAAAWLLVCLFELAVWAEGPRFPSLARKREVVEGSTAEPDEVTDPEAVAAPVEEPAEKAG